MKSTEPFGAQHKTNPVQQRTGFVFYYRLQISDSFCACRSIAGRVSEKTAKPSAPSTMTAPTQAVLVTEPVWANAKPPIAEPKAIPI